MQIDIGAIKDPKVRAFYALTWSQHQILLDFYNTLEEGQYDFRIVERPERKADTPRESLAHILYVQLVYWNAMQTGKLEFKSMGSEHHAQMKKSELLTMRLNPAIARTLRPAFKTFAALATSIVSVTGRPIDVVATPS